MKSNTRIIIVVAVIVLALIVIFARNKSGDDVVTPKEGEQNVLVYFIDNANPATTTSCGITRGVLRDIDTDGPAHVAALKELFKGPNRSEQNAGLVSTFEPTEMQADSEALGDYFIDASIENGLAIINFKPEALSYLNSSACMQEAVKRPIENTIRQFPGVEMIEYAINGEIFREWDA